VPRGVVADVIVVAAAYQPGASEGAQAGADAAVGRLLGLLALPARRPPRASACSCRSATPRPG
jgi:hypothetical protein